MSLWALLHEPHVPALFGTLVARVVYRRHARTMRWINTRIWGSQRLLTAVGPATSVAVPAVRP